MTTDQVFEAALGISKPWYVAGLDFESGQRKLTIRVDFEVGTRFSVPGRLGRIPCMTL
jgi:transposase